MKLLIGIPTGGAPARPFLDALGALRLPPAVTDADRLVWSGNFVPAQREMIVRNAIARGFDFLAMVDDDMIVPPDALELLLEALQADPSAAVAGALYYSRDSARPMAVTRWNSTDTTSAAIPAFGGGRVSEVDGVGFGCVVLRVAALRALAPPYFAAHLYVDEAARVVRQCDEDYLLCERLRANGARVLLHAGVRAPHFDRTAGTTAPVRWEDEAETNRLRMIVLRDGRTELVPFDDSVPRASEIQEPFPAALLFAGS
ncbi:MAG TPA: glycosyltransferase [Candidatus Elarobacter sp.]|nr:glycosyltransferase [Candidatus Elarobacter sp.]